MGMLIFYWDFLFFTRLFYLFMCLCLHTHEFRYLQRPIRELAFPTTNSAGVCEPRCISEPDSNSCERSFCALNHWSISSATYREISFQYSIQVMEWLLLPSFVHTLTEKNWNQNKQSLKPCSIQGKAVYIMLGRRKV